MKQIATKCGFTLEIDENALDNMEVIDALAEAQDDNPLMFSKAILLLIGKKQRSDLYGAIKESKGGSNVTVEDITGVFEDIIEQLGDSAKN